MIEASDIDDDYFTPKPSTSLANIFGGPSTKETSNETLKYTPPKKQVQQDTTVPQNVEPKPDEDSKATECIFARALTAYEWINGNYSPRGMVGFAIIKITKTCTYSVVLYNSNKTTLSNTIVTSKLNMTLKGNNYISYYDTQNKYWSLYGQEEEIKEVIEILKTLGVDVKHTLHTDENPPEPYKTESEKVSTTVYEKESDTDSSVNRRTKASILNRMANMGHSVLPPSPLADKSSDSSDSHELENQPPKIRPKPTKAAMKRTSVEKKGLELDIADTNKMPVAKIETPNKVQSINPALFAMVNGQLVPVSNTNVMASYGSSNNNEMNLYMTEQRMNNNELRININRTTDKIDQVLEKLKAIDKSDGDKSNQFQMEIMQKLLTEYENKIKNYEQILASKNVAYEQQSKTSEKDIELESYKTQISNLQSIIEEKDKKIIQLSEKNDELELVKEISHYKENLCLKTEELQKVTKELEESRRATEHQDFENKLKNVMNDVYGSISVNFDNDESYSGSNVKKILASIIKKSTIQCLTK